jgi:hypothetical protein
MRDDKDLLAAYVDGVGELTPEERRRVESVLADPAGRADEAATRELIGELRELPPTGREPDWAAMERSISDAVGPEVPRSWWRRWRLALPAFAVAATAALVFLVVRPDRQSEQVTAPTQPPPVPSPVPDVEPEPVFAVYLDGESLELELTDEDLLDDELDDALLDDELASDGLFPDDLAWVDDIAEEDLDRALGWLNRKGRG